MFPKISLIQPLLILVTFFSFLSSTYSQGRPRSKAADTIISSQHSDKWIDLSKNSHGSINAGKDAAKNAYFMAPGIDKVIIKNYKTGETVTYVTGKDKISLKRETAFDITFYCRDYSGVKSVTTSGSYQDGLPGQLVLQYATFKGEMDAKGNYNSKFSFARPFHTYSDKPNYKYQKGSFRVDIENSKGEKSFHNIEFSLY